MCVYTCIAVNINNCPLHGILITFGTVYIIIHIAIHLQLAVIDFGNAIHTIVSIV